MKKLFCGFIMSFIIMFFIWTMVAWITLPDFIENVRYYHLDLYSMFNRFSSDKYSSIDFLSTFRSFISSMEKLNTSSSLYKALESSFLGGAVHSNSFKVLISLLNSLISPIYTITNFVIITGYLVVLIVQFLTIVATVLTAIYDFVFSPVFVKLIP